MSYVVFDILRLDGQDLFARTYTERRALLSESLEPGPFVVVPESFDDGAALLEITESQGLEGVVAKKAELGLPTWCAQHRLDQGAAST